MNSLVLDIPQGSLDNVDFIINISDQNPKWTIINKERTSVKTEIDVDSVGKFRSDLSKLKVLRQNMSSGDKSAVIPLYSVYSVPPVVITRTSNVSSVHKTPRLFTTQISSLIPSTSPIPSNPLIDQTIRIYKPAAWIDCISRESKRVFVKDNWIVARILLPSMTKDLIGLKRVLE